MRSDTILFDVNETLLDLRPLGHQFQRRFGAHATMDAWFARMLHASTVCVVTDVRTDFRRLARAGLERAAAEAGVRLSSVDYDDILKVFGELPAHADAAPALERLRSAGFRTVAFSNSSTALLSTQMAGAGLGPLVDDVVSVERFASFKPDPAVYRGVAREVDRPVGALWLVACHDWDCHGALQAGLRAAWVQRGPAPYSKVYRPPEVEGATLGDVVDGLLAEVG